jgi:glycosyltransferase involved in cell wall biosynthesis
VNPEVERNGAATVTRGLLKVLNSQPFGAEVDFIPFHREPRKWHRLAQARSVLQAFVSDLPSKAVFLKSREFLEQVKARIRQKTYDLIVLNGSDLLWISEFLPPSIPRILVAHNIEHRLFDYQIQNLGTLYGPLRRVLRKDCQRLEAFEWRGIQQTGNVMFLSAEEAAYANGVCKNLRSIVVPPLFDYKPWRRPAKKPGAVLEIGYMGNFKWWPNRLGLRWFTTEVLPHVKSPIRLHLFGGTGGPDGQTHPRVVNHGVVEDIQRIWGACDLLICPALPSGGVCVKLAEAVYNGMPVIANTHAGRGLVLGEDPALVFMDEPREWIDFLNSHAARDLAARSVSSAVGREFAVETHTASILAFVEEVISKPFVSEYCA